MRHNLKAWRRLPDPFCIGGCHSLFSTLFLLEVNDLKRSGKELCVIVGVFLILYGLLSFGFNCVPCNNNTLYALVYLALLNPILGAYILVTGYFSLSSLGFLRVAMQSFSFQNSYYATATILFWAGPIVFLAAGVALVLFGKI